MADQAAREAQSAATKEANFEDAAAKIGQKMKDHPEQITSEDASLLESREHRAMGVRPPSDTIAAEAQRLATANEQGTGSRANTNGSSSNQNNMTRDQQSQATREANYQDLAGKVAGKMANDPSSVTKEEGNMLHSREQRAYGTTEKGGLASQAQHAAITGDAGPAAASNPAEESQKAREANLQETVGKVAPKLAHEPENVTKQQANELHSREQRAYGKTEKGGLASQAHSTVAENEKP